ncbi:MAG: cell division protein FtsA [Prevotellaceae bacterium]|nr:cell division protein FtsA [Prevotellaceae bacterium]
MALEFGSSAIVGAAGFRKEDGSLKALDVVIEKTAESIQRGVVYNIDTTASAINNIVAHINSKLGTRVRRAYVGVSGQSLHTVGNVISRKLESKLKITDELMDNFMDSNLATNYPDSEILHVIPQEYIVGHHSVSNPVGIQAEEIEARYVNVVARRLLNENIAICMQKAGLEIADILISPLALADSLLSESEKRSGCALVDFGAATTTVSIYTNNLLRFLTVIPLGGGNITADLVSAKQMYAEEAEGIKRKHGVAYVASETDNPVRIPINNNRIIDENELQNIIGARQEEIIMNAWEQIKPMQAKLLAGIITTGGAAQMKDLAEAIKHFTGFDRVKAAKSLITSVEVARDVLTPQDTSIDTLMALLMHGRESCVSPVGETAPAEAVKPVQEPEPVPEYQAPEPEQKPKEQRKKTVSSWITKGGRWLNDIVKSEEEEE